MSEKTDNILFTILRVVIGFIFLWAFFDKTFGLGRTFPDLKVNGASVTVGTLPADAWIKGHDPAWGFLTYGTQGKFFQDFFSGLAGNQIVTYLYMIGLLAIGIAIFFGIARRIGAFFGIIFVLTLWFASIPISTNPIIDDHIIFAAALAVIGFTDHCGYIFIPPWKKVGERIPLLK